MNIADASALLTFASAGDNRNVTREASLIWSEALDANITLADARQAIVSHFANSGDYLKPAHVNSIVRGWQRDRARDLPPLIPPRDLADNPQREIEWSRVWGDAFIAGHTEDSSRAIANRQFGITEDEPPLAIEAHVGALRESLDRTAREMADKERIAQIQAEVDRQAKEKRRAEQAEAEKTRTAERKPEPTREVRDPADVIASHTTPTEETPCKTA